MTKFDFESVIMDLLKDRPASAETISVITGLPTNYILTKLRRMEKWGYVFVTTKKEVLMWSSKGPHNCDSKAKANACRSRACSQ